MDNSECVLTGNEAQELALASLTKRWPCTSFRIREDEILVRAFGWVFSVEAITKDKAMEQRHSRPPRLVVVHNRSRQVVGTSRPYTAVSIAKIYESLLTRSPGNWCLTMGTHLGDSIPAIASGLEDISVLPPTGSV
jgi:hypothetical protein